jgi:hypothetical protein
VTIEHRESDLPFPLDAISRSFIEGHLKRKSLGWEEGYFLETLGSASKHDVYWAVIALRGCGTDKSVEPLKELLHHPMQDVKATSILTIAHIAGARETPFFAQALLDPAYSQKVYALWALEDCADERGADAVLEYFRANQSRIKSSKFTIEALNFGIRYHAGSAAPAPTFSSSWISSRRALPTGRWKADGN